PEAVADSAAEPGPEPEPEAATAEAGEAAAPAAAPPPAPAASARVAGEYAVQAGDTLSEIVQGMPREAGVSANQMMLALLRTNPGAFIGGNVNLLRAGAVLRMPVEEEARRLSVADASAEVRAQVARWRELSAPRPQPGESALAQAGGTGDGDGGDAAQAPPPGPVADARLEIAPPASA